MSVLSVVFSGVSLGARVSIDVFLKIVPVQMCGVQDDRASSPIQESLTGIAAKNDRDPPLAVATSPRVVQPVFVLVQPVFALVQPVFALALGCFLQF